MYPKRHFGHNYESSPQTNNVGVSKICDLLRENRPSGVVCQNLVMYRVGCTSNGWSHSENLSTISCGVILMTMIEGQQCILHE